MLAAYGWPTDIGEEDLLARLLKQNQERSAGAEAPLVVMAAAKAAKPAKVKAKAKA